MTRIRALAVLCTLVAVLGVPAAFAQETTSPPGDQPAIVLEEPAAPPGDEAWTFRFLIPTVLAISGLIVAATLAGYGLRVRGRYRVVR